jgi:hypothetical protein
MQAFVQLPGGHNGNVSLVHEPFALCNGLVGPLKKLVLHLAINKSRRSGFLLRERLLSCGKRVRFWVLVWKVCGPLDRLTGAAAAAALARLSVLQ